MKHSLFKYVSNVDHAYSLLDGQVFHQTLGYFRDYVGSESKQVIGDEFESTHIFRPASGLQINNLSRGASSQLDMGFEPSARAGEIYIFCVSRTMTEELKREFGAVACVEIFKPKAFAKRWRNALPQSAKYFVRKIRYYERDDLPGNVWPQPRLIATTKLANFANQQEYRFGFSTTGALDFGSVTLQLVDRQARPSPNRDEHRNRTFDLEAVIAFAPM